MVSRDLVPYPSKKMRTRCQGGGRVMERRLFKFPFEIDTSYFSFKAYILNTWNQEFPALSWYETCQNLKMACKQDMACNVFYFPMIPHLWIWQIRPKIFHKMRFLFEGRLHSIIKWKRQMPQLHKCCSRDDDFYEVRVVSKKSGGWSQFQSLYLLNLRLNRN